ncbi:MULTISPECIES: Fe(3+)-hydroxamate ABC transporter permease FhuB [Rahnella]|uniref:Fe(3+)-hydroxamate ABC transporter permease FhuB n=1 Tax=Rahnella laticis TaxID=2787622 RepID=A0ABS0EB18_9GAMM|nr:MULTISPECIES: Fe(3+)-hydroxamate ABC transporter permease FhuB [Rahnella]MBF7981303.1 Fe(3+)-hydroxamate ABC transporter permease FhuB [Rahnella laticis]MBF8001395.1 Fe(3+)-hydroxamate ABC transporter permease FhuB [Rahnella sp. LAC-M12]
MRKLSALPWLIILPLALLCALLLISNLGRLHAGNLPSTASLLLHYSFLPRLATGALAGMALATAGLLFQQVLRNPLAEPATLGIAAGANLAMSAGIIVLPGLLVFGLTNLALAGAALTALVLYLLIARQGLDPLKIILTGMVISLYGNSVNTLMVLFNHDYLSDLFSWQAGSLNQNGWPVAQFLLLPVLCLMAGSALLARPLMLIGLSDLSAGALGVSVVKIRIATLAVAVALSALITSQVGIISFIGLAAPALVRLAGVRRFTHQLICVPLAGAGLLTAVDQLAQFLSPAGGDLPTGALAGLLSAPLMLMLLFRQRNPYIAPQTLNMPVLRTLTRRRVAVLLLMLAGGIALSLFVNCTPDTAAAMGSLLQWRWPRMLGALSAGAMLAVAGVLIQRQSGNPLASPELLGISSGASLMVVLLVILFNQPLSQLFPAALAGSLLAIFTLFMFGMRSRFQPQSMVMVGLCLTNLSMALSMLLLMSGDPRAMMLLNWSTGSTAGITPERAMWGAGQALVLIPLALLLQRRITLLSLGQQTTRALGAGVRRSNMLILLPAAALTAGGTLLIGPLSFVGLIAPQLARYSGANRFRAQCLLAALYGGLLMVIADWLGRNIAWPWPVSAGMLCALLGGPWFLWGLVRR